MRYGHWLKFLAERLLWVDTGLRAAAHNAMLVAAVESRPTAKKSHWRPRIPDPQIWLSGRSE